MESVSNTFWVCLVVNGLISSAIAQNGTVILAIQQSTLMNITGSFTYRTKDEPKRVTVNYPTANNRVLTKIVTSGRQHVVNETLKELQMDEPKLTIISTHKLNATFSHLEYTLQICPTQEGLVMVVLNLNFHAGSIHNEYNVLFAEKDSIRSTTIEPSKTTKDIRYSFSPTTATNKTAEEKDSIRSTTIEPSKITKDIRYSFSPTTAPNKTAKGTKESPTPTPGADNHAIGTSTASMSSLVIAAIVVMGIFSIIVRCFVAIFMPILRN